jgi:cell division FtsZ-interacting protein ZapD
MKIVLKPKVKLAGGLLDELDEVVRKYRSVIEYIQIDRTELDYFLPEANFVSRNIAGTYRGIDVRISRDSEEE